MVQRWYGAALLSLILCACGSATEKKTSYVEMAKELIHNENIPKARVALMNALKIDPQDSEALFLMDQVSEKDHNWPSSLAQHASVVELDSTHRESIGQTIPTRRETLWNLFQSNLSKQQWQQAANLIIRLKNTGASAYQIDLAVGLLAASRQQWNLAVQALILAQRTNIHALPPLAALIKVCLARRRPEQARAYLEKILVQHPNHMFASGLLGAVLWELKDKHAALSAFERQTQVNPRWIEPWKDWASLQWAEGQRGKALEILKAAIVQNPDSLVLLSTLASYYQAEDQFDLAIKQYDAILRHDARDIMAANNLAYLLADKKGDSQSLEIALALTQHFETQTQNPFLLDTLAWVYYKMGLHRKAASVLKNTVHKAPDHPLINYHFGLMTLKIGDRITAIRHLKKAVQSASDLDNMEEARHLLAEIAI